MLSASADLAEKNSTWREKKEGIFSAPTLGKSKKIWTMLKWEEEPGQRGEAKPHPVTDLKGKI